MSQKRSASRVKILAFLFRLRKKKNMKEDKQPSLRINQGRPEREREKSENTLATLTATRYSDRLGESVHRYLRQQREAKGSELGKHFSAAS